MKFTLFKSRQKRDGGLRIPRTPVVNAISNGCQSEAMVHANIVRHYRKSSGDAFRNTPIDPEPENALYVEFLQVHVIGCHIENDIESFEEHEFAAIARQIENTYLSDVEFFIRHRHSYDTTIVADLFINRFSEVFAVDIVHPIIYGNDIFHKDLEERVTKWEFPSVLRQGKCRVVFSKKGHL